MTKEQLLEQCITRLAAESGRLAGSSQSARQASIEAPGPMQSHSDTTKFQQDWLSQQLADAGSQVHEALKRLRLVRLSPSNMIDIGSLVTLREQGKKDLEIYFVLPSGAGMTLGLGSQKVIVVTPKTPLGKAMIKKSAGDSCAVQTPQGIRQLVIDSVE